jgi:hypothetical protein
MVAATFGLASGESKGCCNHDRDQRVGVDVPLTSVPRSGRTAFPIPYWPIQHPTPENTLATLQSAPLACCRWELQQRHMTPPSKLALRIVEEDAKLVRRLNTYYADAAADGGLDTVERDALLDALGRHFVRQPWPRSGSMDATGRFVADLQRAMTRAGWRVDLLAGA